MVSRINGALALTLTIIVAACGSSSSPAPTPTPTPQPQPNRAPTITTMTVAPAFGIAGITQFNVSSSATDPDGDALTYTWEFADGSTGVGASVAHNYGNIYGTGDVRLTGKRRQRRDGQRYAPGHGRQSYRRLEWLDRQQHPDPRVLSTGQ